MTLIQDQLQILRANGTKTNGHPPPVISQLEPSNAQLQVVLRKDEAAAERLNLGTPAKVSREDLKPKTMPPSPPAAAAPVKQSTGKKDEASKVPTRFENTLFGNMKGKKK